MCSVNASIVIDDIFMATCLFVDIKVDIHPPVRVPQRVYALVSPIHNVYVNLIYIKLVNTMLHEHIRFLLFVYAII